MLASDEVAADGSDVLNVRPQCPSIRGRMAILASAICIRNLVGTVVMEMAIAN